VAKWRWRLLNDGNALWKEVLVEKYGGAVGGLLVEEEYVWPAHVSRWWRELVRLDDSHWFNFEIIRKVGKWCEYKVLGGALEGRNYLMG